MIASVFLSSCKSAYKGIFLSWPEITQNCKIDFVGGSFCWPTPCGYRSMCGLPVMTYAIRIGWSCKMANNKNGGVKRYHARLKKSTLKLWIIHSSFRSFFIRKCWKFFVFWDYETFDSTSKQTVCLYWKIILAQYRGLEVGQYRPWLS